MLDNGTKQRIDSARDILVGKIPSPQAQVEQITIALIYKFMDDMDQESLKMGGNASFFTGEFEKYAWSKMFDPHLGGYDLLALYSEAITRMNENPGAPQLFRDIFKNAYLPYRDPETLKLFLKVINEFHYDHSERLGDAFEYLLSVLSSQGDAGQFRTPRHIIEFMVQVVDPKKNETVLDPACGTAGFLISSYKHIRQANTAKTPGDLFTVDERKRMVENFKGYDISPDMVRLSLVNMYLHGFVSPQIYEYDTLTSEDRWHEYADVILANPPFMSPTGGIRPHKNFSVQSKRSEVLFVDYMAEHLTPNGKAAIIVPEGIIFQSGTAYKQLRKYLVEKDFLWAVVSLPAGIFQPYSGVKTSILFLDKVLAKKTDKILFVKVENDGFGLGAQRREIEKNDLPATLEWMKSWQQSVNDGYEINIFENCLLVHKDKLAESREYILTSERYRKSEVVGKKSFEMKRLDEISKIFIDGNWIESDDQSEFGIRLIQTGNIGMGEYKDKFDKSKYISESMFNKLRCTEVFPGDILISRLPDPVGRACIVPKLNTRAITAVDCTIVRLNEEEVLPNYFLYISITNQYFQNISQYLTGASRQRISRSNLGKVKIPIPPLEVQHEIIGEIEGYQRIIDGARMVVENWKPNIELELEEARKEAGGDTWEEVELGELCDFVRGPFGGSLKKEIFVKDGYLVYEQNHAINGDFSFGRYYIDENKFQEMKRFEVFSGDILISCSGTMGKVALVPNNHKKGIINQALLKLTAKLETNPLFLKYYLESEKIQARYFRNQQGVAIQNVSSVKVMKSIKTPNLSLKLQNQIVNKIESERFIIVDNNRLISLFEDKIQKAIGRVWE